MQTDYTDRGVLAQRVIFDIARLIGEHLTGEGTPPQTRLLVHDIEVVVMKHAHRIGLITDAQLSEVSGAHKAKAAVRSVSLV